MSFYTFFFSFKKLYILNKEKGKRSEILNNFLHAHIKEYEIPMGRKVWLRVIFEREMQKILKNKRC